MTVPRTAGERLADLISQVETLTERVAVLEQQTTQQQETLRTVFGLFQILPDLLNQNMPAVRASEVRKFKNHLDFVFTQHIQRINESKEAES